MTDRFDQLRAMGIRTVTITGDNRLTAAKIAEESGVDNFLAEATPEKKLELSRTSRPGPDDRDDRRWDQRRPGARSADVGVTMKSALRPPARRATWSTSSNRRS